MGRPSLKAQRTNEILDAVGRCILQDGVSGLTLEGIAKEADMHRSILRHYIGNRDQLLEAFLNRYFLYSDQQVKGLLAYLPQENRPFVLVDLLFGEHEEDYMTRIASVLFASAQNNEQLAKRLTDWNARFIDIVYKEICWAYPTASKEDSYCIAAGIIGIYFNVESMKPIGLTKSFRLASKNASKRLIYSLETQQKNPNNKGGE